MALVSDGSSVATSLSGWWCGFFAGQTSSAVKSGPLATAALEITAGRQKVGSALRAGGEFWE